ncbi:MAG: lipid-A-disaccharide synthase [Rhodocyclaceae bacterium]|nr:lipid-A-disaccharide synthase [Rhodocyclaceae bacterium]
MVFLQQPRAEAASHAPLIGIVAGEASGDLLGAGFIEAVRSRWPDARFVGIGGPRMLAAGMHTLFPQEMLAVRGYVEVLRRLPALLRVRRRLGAYFLRERPDVFVGVDAPDFNLTLERRLKAAGIATIHYVSPSIWAWRGGRIRSIGKAADRVLALFPMEPPLYKAAGIPVTYVGHPLASRLPMHPDTPGARRSLRIDALAQPVVVLMPGSRLAEVEHLGLLFIRTAERLLDQHPEAVFLVPMATRPTFERFRWLLRFHARRPDRFQVLFGHAHQALEACDAALIASGTATLEAALLKKPMVISYRMPWLSYQLMRWRAYLPWVGLPNILAGRQVVPELLQRGATEEALAEALAQQLANPEREAQRAAFAEIHRALLADTQTAIVDAVASSLERSRMARAGM